MSQNQPFSFFVQWHLTERCNLACAHCYQGSASPKEMTLSEIEGIMDDIGDMLKSWSDSYGISYSPGFNITGGEPFLRSDLFPILEAAEHRGFPVSLLTNGTLIDGTRARALSDFGVQGVQVSLEGPPAVHDGIRGEGSFFRSLAGIQHLLSARIPVTLNATLSRVNSGHFGELVDLARGLKVERLGFSRLVPSGRGMDLGDSMITGEELRVLYENIFSREEGDLEFVTGDPVASQMRGPSEIDTKSAIPTGGCAAGISGLTLLPDGTVLPCRRLNIPVGNALGDSLREIWATSGVLNDLRTKSLYKGKCGSCERWSLCRGCRAIAYAYSLRKREGDYLAEDPQCFMYCSPTGSNPSQ
jgi:AdoMet-dependent heme synthase